MKTLNGIAVKRSASNQLNKLFSNTLIAMEETRLASIVAFLAAIVRFHGSGNSPFH